VTEIEFWIQSDEKEKRREERGGGVRELTLIESGVS
jgi:hypothetical protein